MIRLHVRGRCLPTKHALVGNAACLVVSLGHQPAGATSASAQTSTPSTTLSDSEWRLSDGVVNQIIHPAVRTKNRRLHFPVRADGDKFLLAEIKGHGPELARFGVPLISQEKMAEKYYRGAASGREYLHSCGYVARLASTAACARQIDGPVVQLRVGPLFAGRKY